jgi:thiamine biosynthesis lipoprotein
MQLNLSASRLCASITLVILFTGCTEPPAELQLAGATMGTTWTVRVADCETANCGSLDAAFTERLQELTGRLSHYEPASELSRFNDHAGTDWFPAPTDLTTVVAYAQKVSRQTDGAFDITVAPAVNVWGFGPADTDLSSTGLPNPSSAQLAQALEHSGYSKLSVRESPGALRKTDPLVRLDLSALAKGYAADQLAYLIETAGSTNYMVEIGGEVRTSGFRPDAEPWRIGIQPPDASLAIEFVVTPGDAALATSGDYRNYYMLDDRRISHTIDPASGAPVTNNLASVSVIAPDTMQADALATAIMVMGAEAGMKFARGNNIAVLIIQRTPDGTHASMSPEFEPYLL